MAVVGRALWAGEDNVVKENGRCIYSGRQIGIPNGGSREGNGDKTRTQMRVRTMKRGEGRRINHMDKLIETLLLWACIEHDLIATTFLE